MAVLKVTSNAFEIVRNLFELFLDLIGIVVLLVPLYSFYEVFQGLLNRLSLTG